MWWGCIKELLKIAVANRTSETTSVCSADGSSDGRRRSVATLNRADGCWICIGYVLDGLPWMGVGWLLDGCWIGVRYALDGFQIGAWIGDGWDSDRC